MQTFFCCYHQFIYLLLCFDRFKTNYIKAQCNVIERKIPSLFSTDNYVCSTYTSTLRHILLCSAKRRCSQKRQMLHNIPEKYVISWSGTIMSGTIMSGTIMSCTIMSGTVMSGTIMKLSYERILRHLVSLCICM